MAEKLKKYRIPAKQPAGPRRSDSVHGKDSVLIKEDESQFPLSPVNFKMMIIAAVMIVAGFLLMLGGSSTESEFNPDIFSTRRIVIGPTIAFLGFVAMGVAIIWSPRRKAAKKQNVTEEKPQDNGLA